MRGFFNPRDLTEAVSWLRDHPTWRGVCGGTDIWVHLQNNAMRDVGFVNLWNVLPRHIEQRGGMLHIGAGVTCAALADSRLIREKLPALWEAARTMGSPQVRNRATLGGNIGNASPAADMSSALLIDDPWLTLRSSNGEREVPLRRIFLGPGKTCVAPDELVVELRVPVSDSPSYCRFDKLGFRQAQVIAVVNFSIRLRGRKGGIDTARLSWGSVAPTPVRSHTIEGILSGVRLSDRVQADARDALEHDIAPIDDHRASAAYRLSVARGYLERALQESRAWLSS